LISVQQKNEKSRDTSLYSEEKSLINFQAEEQNIRNKKLSKGLNATTKNSKSKGEIQAAREISLQENKKKKISRTLDDREIK
jgi:hypothetical protein